MVVAAEALARRGALAGDLLVATNTDEESSGAGGMALVERGVHADGAIVTEPTGFDVWVSCRGSTYATITVPGRAGHAGIAHPDWRQGGAGERDREGRGGPRRAPGRARALGGRFLAATPAIEPPGRRADLDRGRRLAGHDSLGETRITTAVTFVPARANADGWASRVESEVSEAIAAACAADDWLAKGRGSRGGPTR